MCDTHSEQINELAKALAAAQGELEPAEKNSTAAVGKEGKLKRKYADLTAMIDAVRKVLPKHGLSIAQIVLCRFAVYSYKVCIGDVDYGFNSLYAGQ